jgi:hypothetical protein
LKFIVDGVTYEQIDQDRLTWAEIDAMERACGMTMAEVQRKSMTCVCAHYTVAHPKTDDGTACTRCDCPEFAPAVPTRVTTAGLWVSMKRSNPTLTYEQAAQVSMDSIGFEDDEAPKDLAEEGLLPAASPNVETTTSPTLPTSSASTPGTSSG